MNVMSEKGYGENDVFILINMINLLYCYIM